MSYTLVLEWMPGDLYMSAVTARCTAPTSSYSVVWLPPNKVYQITLYCGSTSLVSFLVGAFRGKAWSYMNRINWKVRIANKTFWLSLIPAALLLVQVVASVFGFTLDLGELGNKLLEVVNALFAVLAILGVINDPTTAGVADSQRAMSYEAPYKSGEDERIGDSRD